NNNNNKEKVNDRKRPKIRRQLTSDISKSSSARKHQSTKNTGVIDGVGVLNSQWILEQMITPLASEYGTMEPIHIPSIDCHDMKFLLSNPHTLQDCGKLIFALAKAQLSINEKTSVPMLFFFFSSLKERKKILLFFFFFFLLVNNSNIESNIAVWPRFVSRLRQKKQSESKNCGVGAGDVDLDKLIPLLDVNQLSHGNKRKNFFFDSKKKKKKKKKKVKMTLFRLEKQELQDVMPEQEIATDPNLSCQVLFFGNEHYYLLYRYLQKIYAKLEHAKHCCALDYTLKHSLTEQEKSRKYLQLMETTMAQISKEKQEDLFQDTVRQLLGLQGYHFFSVPKIVQLLVHNVDKSHEYLALFLFMSQKFNSIKTLQELRIYLNTKTMWSPIILLFLSCCLNESKLQLFLLKLDIVCYAKYIKAWLQRLMTAICTASNFYLFDHSTSCPKELQFFFLAEGEANEVVYTLFVGRKSYLVKLLKVTLFVAQTMYLLAVQSNIVALTRFLFVNFQFSENPCKICIVLFGESKTRLSFACPFSFQFLGRIAFLLLFIIFRSRMTDFHYFSENISFL
ncbi:hypothetical protein RFI_11205, partial [Reticulomyxa filosa]